MGSRGPTKRYDVVIRLDITHSQDEFVEAMATLQGCSKQEVVRRMIDSFWPYSLVRYADQMKEK